MDFIFLADFNVIKPNIGLIFWTTVIFGIFWFMMSKYAFKPIAKALSDREAFIKDSLEEANNAREEMAKLKSQNEEILAQARVEQAKILKEAKEAKDTIIKDAKVKAKEEANKIVTSARQEIDNQKMAAMLEVKNKAGLMALEIAEKVIRKELVGNSEQESFANSLVNEIKLN